MSLPTATAQTPTSPTGTPNSSSTFSTSFTGSASASPTMGSGASSTTASSFSRPTSNDDAPDTFDQNDGNDSIKDSHSGLINYYFVFLALFVILAFLGVYFLNRRRRARKLAYLNSGQNALARDMDGWVSNARRWHWRNESRNDEGLNELGQAPPAYSAKAHSREASAEAGVTANEPPIPLPTLASDERQRDLAKPPAYSEAMRADSTAGSRAAGGSRSPSPPAASGGSRSQEGASRP